jgi:hypothetical protein
VIRAVARQDFVSPGKKPCDLDRILVRFRAAIRKEEGVDVPRGNFGEFGAQARAWFRGHEWVGIG